MNKDLSMGFEVTSIFVTGCFWYWTVYNITVTISPLREESRWHRRLANLAFLSLVSIQLLSLMLSSETAAWFISFLSSLTVLLILVFSKFDREGFWSKPRNQLVGSMVLAALGVGLPVIFNQPSIIALSYAAILANEFHRAQTRQFLMIHKDLDSLRSKVSKLEANIWNSRIEKKAADNPPKLSVYFKNDASEFEKRQHH